MYQPAHHRQDDFAAQAALIRARPLGLLITRGAGGLNANPIPFLLADNDGPPRLVAHMARANPQWREEGEALVVFTDADAYVTPSWYATKKETGKVVPTWNYATVHVHGTLRAIDDRDWLRAQVEALTKTHEAGRADPWAVSDAPDDYVEQMLRAIVGVEIAISRIEGKWKVSQNRPAEDRAGVVVGLAAQGDETSRAMARMVDEAARR